MPRLRVTGIVAEANRVRRALTLPLSAEQREQYAARIRTTVLKLEAILARHRARPADLSPPSRRAYQFLRSVDLRSGNGAVAGAADGAPAGPDATSLASRERNEARNGIPGRLPESITFLGLRAYLDQLLDDLALSIEGRRVNPPAVLRVIRRTAERLESCVQSDQLSPEQLKPESRGLFGWFRYFSAEPALAAYIDAISRATAMLTRPAAPLPAWRLPALVQFRPAACLYRWRVMRAGTRVVFRTPLLAANEDVLRHLRSQMQGRPQHPAVTEFMLSEDYQHLSAELESAGGIVEGTRGVAYDLQDSFARVNREYFGGAMPRPRLAWSRTLTGRLFGHYDFVRDAVMISATLDSPGVPEFVLDHVMHHELLHKKHGFEWHGTRRHSHTTVFRADERAFGRFADADRFLKELGRRT